MDKSNINREDYIASVVRCVFDNGLTIFGGYVRDMISGDTPKDLDVLCPSENKDKVIQSLISAGFMVGRNFKKGLNSDANYSDIHGDVIDTTHLIVVPHDDREIEIEVDLVHARDTYRFNPDFSVNRLALKDHGKTLVCMTDGSLFEQGFIFNIVNAIRNRNVKFHDGISDTRVQKMLDRGYAVDGIPKL